MRRTAPIILTVLYCNQALSQTDVCQTIADAYTSDNELKRYTIPLRKPTAEEAASWPDYSVCKGFSTALNGYYEHPALPMRLLSTDVPTGMRVSYTEILKAPPDCDSRDWKKRYGDALFSFNNFYGLSTKLLVVGNTPVFVIGGFGKDRYIEGLTEAIFVNNGIATGACSFSKTDESIVAESGAPSVCSEYRGKHFLSGVVTQQGRYADHELRGSSGTVKFRPGQPDEVTLKIEYSSLADTYPIHSVTVESKTLDAHDIEHWQRLLVNGLDSRTNVTEWILLHDRPAAVQRFPMQTVISWPDTKMETCTLHIAPRYEPAEPLPYGGARIGEAIGP